MICIPEMPSPTFSSGCVADRLDMDHRRIELFLAAGHELLVKRSLKRMNLAARYLAANFPPAALARGPVAR
jgi:hypothetical protein